MAEPEKVDSLTFALRCRETEIRELREFAEIERMALLEEIGDKRAPQSHSEAGCQCDEEKSGDEGNENSSSSSNGTNSSSSSSNNNSSSSSSSSSDDLRRDLAKARAERNMYREGLSVFKLAATQSFLVGRADRKELLQQASRVLSLVD